jgi:hypothetical protein
MEYVILKGFYYKQTVEALRFLIAVIDEHEIKCNSWDLKQAKDILQKLEI